MVSPKIPNSKSPKNLFYRGFGFEIFRPEIISRDFHLGDLGFFKSADFYPGDREFLKILGLVFPGIGDIPKSGDFYSRRLEIFIPADRGFLKSFYPRG